MKELNFQPDDIIIEENSQGHCAYILKSGQVSVRKHGKNGYIELAVIKAKDIFGELGLIDDRPRSASIVATSDVVVDEISRNDFLTLINDKGKFVIPIFKALFERLRQTNEMVVLLEDKVSELSHLDKKQVPALVKFEGLTPETKELCKQKQLTIKNFPYKIGRDSQYQRDDIFVDNDMFIKDTSPFSVSRNHLSINLIDKEFYVLDRGSSAGTIVNHTLLGGRTTKFKAKLKKGKNIVILGSEISVFKFNIIV